MSPLPKSAPPPLPARAARPAAVRLRGSAVKVIGAGAALVLSGAFVYAFILRPAAADDPDRRVEAPPGPVRPAERITVQPDSYDRLAPKLPPPRTPGEGAQSPPAPSVPARPPPASAAHARLPDESSPAQAAAAAARSSGLFFATEGAGVQTPAGSGAAGAAASPAPPGGDLEAAYGGHRLLEPLSPFEVKAGTLIPAALLTVVDTGRPGPVLAVTTQPVFDSVTGRTVLIPQGSRLIGAQAGDSRYGERRAFVAWKRIILPDGASLTLDDEPAADAAGATGIGGRIERRMLQVAGAALLSGAISTIGEVARGRGSQERQALLDALGEASARQALELGGRFLDRELDVQPRVVVGAGAPVHVLLTRDLVLEPRP